MWSTLVSGTVKGIRSFGQSLDVLGRSFEVNAYVERLQPSVKVLNFKGKSPILNCSFVAPTASIIGDIKIGNSSSVWYGAIIRGDVNTITIGDNVIVGDRAMIHCSGLSGNFPTKIGNSVNIGKGAIIHGCTIDDESVIGDGALVLDGAHVQAKAIVAAGSIVPPGKVIPAGEVWAGAPAVFQRQATAIEIANVPETAASTTELATLYAKEASKTYEQLEADEFEYEQISERNEYYYRRRSPAELARKAGEVEGHTVPGRIFNSPISVRTD